MTSEFDEFISGALDEALGVLGTTGFIIEGLGAVQGVWNDLGRTEVVEIHGKRVGFSSMVEFTRSQLPLATDEQLVGLEGKLVTRSSDGKVMRVVGRVVLDSATVRFPLDTRHK
ncbi:MAG: hypothetical protein ABMA13_23550 [Chthoniobacteraceae bacterium]